MQELKPTEMAHHATPPVHVPISLEKTSHVFVRTDAVRPPLVRPYTGPFRVLKRTAKYFEIEKGGKTDKVSIDRLKPAFTHQGGVNKTDDVTPRAGNSNCKQGPEQRDGADKTDGVITNRDPKLDGVDKTDDVISGKEKNDTTEMANAVPVGKKKRGRPKKSYREALLSKPDTITTRAGRVSRPPRHT